MSNAVGDQDSKPGSGGEPGSTQGGGKKDDEELGKKEMKWEKLRKMHPQRLRLLPLDTLHVLQTGRAQGNSVLPMEGQQKKLETIEDLENEQFILKVMQGIEMSCDCCHVSFNGPNKFRDMLAHIESDEHYNALSRKLSENALYVFELNRAIRQSIPPPPPQKTQQKPPQPKRPATEGGQDAADSAGQSPKKKKAEKHLDIPEAYRPMAEWLACFVCNITCSSMQIYETHAAGKRHQKILQLSPDQTRSNPVGPYIAEGKPTIDTGLGAVKLALANGQTVLVGGGHPPVENTTFAKPQGGPQKGGIGPHAHPQKSRMAKGRKPPNFATGAVIPRSPYAAQLWNSRQQFGSWGPNTQRNNQ